MKIPFAKGQLIKDNKIAEEDITGRLFKIAVKELGLNFGSQAQVKDTTLRNSDSNNTLIRKSSFGLGDPIAAQTSNASKTSATFNIPNNLTAD